MPWLVVLVRVAFDVDGVSVFFASLERWRTLFALAVADPTGIVGALLEGAQLGRGEQHCVQPGRLHAAGNSAIACEYHLHSRYHC